MKNTRLLFWSICAALLVTACGSRPGSANGDGQEEDGSRSKYLSSVTGAPGEVFVIVEKTYWEGDIGTELRGTLTADYPYLPQSEPMFSVFNAPHSAFKGSFCLHRNVVVVNIGGGIDSTGVKYQIDVWAHPQIVVTVYAPDQNAALELIRQEKGRIASAIEQKERDRIITNTKKFEDRDIRMEVASFLGGSPYFTKDFSIKKKTNGFVWVSHETTYVNQGTFFFKIPYVEPEFLTCDWCVDQIDSVLQANVPGMRDNSYMMTNRYIEPGLQYVQYRNRSFVEVRGLWELKNDYMGGPFVCHIFPDSANSCYIVEYGFVYAPKYEKRNYLRTVESILYSYDSGKKASGKKRQ